MNDQELFLRVGELATAAGCPMPAITRVECSPRTLPAKVQPGTVAPELLLRSDAEQWCVEARDLAITQALLAYRMGLPRHLRWYKRVQAVAGCLLAMVATAQWGFLVGAPLALTLFVSLNLVASAIHSRRFVQRLDRQMLPILGADVMAQGLRHMYRPLKPAGVLRWLWAGAEPRGSERLRWLRAAQPGIASVAD
ncbi:hypothetical protein [Kribbella speibonae]|uniref:Uncharacterized protein n=1 Tax=Kribbella speibonae TaxID=1572660 RepID=A0ABY1ZUF4_9ACTN|nr:hypothetical protein [Kribbella speibonae]TCC16498.1 hypothetical protein E0H58_39150 [Kribbella speibonae]